MYYKTSKVLYITGPKTLASNRLIALDDTTIKYLMEWQTIQKRILSQILYFHTMDCQQIKVQQVISLHDIQDWLEFIELRHIP